MSKLTRFVAGNWKMNGSFSTNEQLLNEIVSQTQESHSEIVIFPPFVYLSQVMELLKGSKIVFGAQNVAAEEGGAFTGEVSASMLKDLGCKYVLIGHSERRAYYGDTDEVLVKKFTLAQKNGITPVFCIGETEEERDAGNTETVIKQQLDALIKPLGIGVFKDAVIAYEPVWAIGTGKSATSEEAEQTHQFIRCTLAKYDDTISDLTRIVYGGSVSATNVNGLFAEANINGALVGGASLKAGEFAKIALA